MATRPPTQSQNRPPSGGFNGSSGVSRDVGTDALTRMAREDTRWFVVAVVVLSLVIFLALPITTLLVVDHMKLKAEIRGEIKQLRKFKAELKEQTDAANRRGDSSEPNQQRDAQSSRPSD